VPYFRRFVREAQPPLIGLLPWVAHAADVPSATNVYPERPVVWDAKGRRDSRAGAWFWGNEESPWDRPAIERARPALSHLALRMQPVLRLPPSPRFVRCPLASAKRTSLPSPWLLKESRFSGGRSFSSDKERLPRFLTQPMFPRLLPSPRILRRPREPKNFRAVRLTSREVGDSPTVTFAAQFAAPLSA